MVSPSTSMFAMLAHVIWCHVIHTGRAPSIPGADGHDRVLQIQEYCPDCLQSFWLTWETCRAVNHTSLTHSTAPACCLQINVTITIKNLYTKSLCVSSHHVEMSRKSGMTLSLGLNADRWSNEQILIKLLRFEQRQDRQHK